MKIVEVLGQADPQYFLHEGCAIFAIALRRLLERGDFYIYADTSDRADKWGRSGYEFTHVVLLVDGRLYDVRGIRALSDLAREFAKNAEQMRLLGPFSEPDFRRRFVGSSDRKPFYGPTVDTLREAENIIQASPGRYGLPVSKG